MTPEEPAAPDPPQNSPEPSPCLPLPLPGDVPVTVAEQPPAPPRPWGFWATLGWGLLIFLANAIVEVAVAILAAILGAYGKPLGKLAKTEFESNGLVMAISTLISAPVFCSLIILFAKLRRNMDLSSYLGLRWPGLKTLLRWSIGMGILVALSDTTTCLLGKPIVAEFMIKAYQTAGFAPLLWLAILVAAPVGEELFFRGFMFKGFHHSPLGGPGAIILTALLWAGLHIQYDVYGIGSILLAGVFLGYARLRTGSVWLCVCLHALMNVIATIELLIYLA